MKICLAADANYLQHLIVTMASVIINSNPEEPLEFTVLTDGSIHPDCLNGISLSRSYGVRVINAAELVHEHMEIDAECRWPVAVYYRLLLPSLCESDSRIIYLDCDTIVRKSLDELWNLPMKESSIAGVPDDGFGHKKRLAQYGVQLENEYLNSGVMLWNLDRIRSGDYERKLKDAGMRLPNPEFPDQDWINIMFDAEKKIIPPKWNAMSHIFEQERNAAINSTEELFAAKCDPYICHFTNIKPWTMTYTAHPFWLEYWEYLASTPFAGRKYWGIIKKRFLSSDQSLLYRLVRFIKK
ncbi:glycosyltransferase family 8 protein [Pontiella agarivorans]|uniref:Glycosyltransferase family 8 protein n=1 Tax=Pontiella agarivorans TaxID=3038953 RepID=A0ABU5MU93_9BACT|nr:glycosyltransferase family 8 protein [Pontiella agarivorans]MDZ8117753.1 glycosyltransferase family 8 protein [Pontiella agarivorans]